MLRLRARRLSTRGRALRSQGQPLSRRASGSPAGRPRCLLGPCGVSHHPPGWGAVPTARLYCAAMAAPARLRFDGIRRRFGKLAVLTGVSGTVEAGGVLLVTGPNGSGKSTLLRCLAGLMAPEAGAVE